LVKGEFLEIPSSHTLPNDFQSKLARYQLRNINANKEKNSEDKKIAVYEDIYHLTNETVEVFRKIDAEYGQALWLMIFRDWLAFCKEQIKVDELGK